MVQRNKRRLKVIRRTANFQRNRRSNLSGSAQSKHYRHGIYKKRVDILINAHSHFTYSNDPLVVKVEGAFGIEENESIDDFVNIAASMIDFDNKELIIDLEKCTRVWPSAVTLMCSLKEWVEFGATKNKLPHPKIQSTDSENISVNAYLTHCGFHDYVGRKHQPVSQEFSDKHVVKIKREFKRDGKSIGCREDQIEDLLKDVTDYPANKIKYFVSVITEVFGNVQEHSICCQDQGWWILAQYHEKHKTVSINIADNGIGFKNSLLSGPQRDQIREELGRDTYKEGTLIQHAMKENVSGAVDASIKEQRFIQKGYRRGSGRGNGLDRIRNTCKELGVRFAVLSHYGYLFYDQTGKMIKSGTKEKRVFAGTLYHFDFPTKKEKNI